MSERAKPGARRVQMASVGVVTMLIIQFILGMIYNIYGTAPTATKSVGMFSSVTLSLHVIMGILLVITAIMQIVRTTQLHHRTATILSWVGLVAIIAAWGTGEAFIQKGANGASLGMSLAFAVALACYVGGIQVLSPKPVAA
jgi:heme A synthase